jgi:hypothetical protein
MYYHTRRPVPEDVESALDATWWESLRPDVGAYGHRLGQNCPHTPAIYHLLSARRLRLLQPHSILVNTARGEIVDEEELIRLIEIRAIAGAGLDVFEHEPAVDPRLTALDNVVLLPHMGSSTIEGRIAMGERVIINIKTSPTAIARPTASSAQCCDRAAASVGHPTLRFAPAAQRQIDALAPAMRRRIPKRSCTSRPRTPRQNDATRPRSLALTARRDPR